MIDNVRIRMTHAPVAPIISYGVDMEYSDNFNQGSSLNVMGVANADVHYDIHRDPPPDLPDLLGDSLEVEGGIPTRRTASIAGSGSA